MDIVEKLRLVDCTFWYKPLGHGIDTDLDVPAYELGALSREAADEIERLREAAKDRPKDRPNEAANEIERLREENNRQRYDIMLLNSMIQTEHEIIRIAALKEGE